jgi:hypothetical protein
MNIKLSNSMLKLAFFDFFRPAYRVKSVTVKRPSVLIAKKGK